MPAELSAELVSKKRKTLIFSAVEILELHGIEALTLRRLATACNVSRTTPYLYFKDKSALLDAIRVHVLLDLMEKFKLSIVEICDPVKQMRVLSDELISFGLSHSELYHLIFITGISRKAMAKEFCDTISQYKIIVNAPMQKAYDENLISLPPQRLNPVIWAAIHGMLTLKGSGLVGSEDDFDQLRADLGDILSTGFAVNP